MSTHSLPELKDVTLPPLPHFPTRMQAAIFRMWETVPAKRISEALEIPLDKIYELAQDMGLGKQKYTDAWMKFGYITTIRNLWYLLPYEQLLKVLGWTDSELAEILVNDDFLSVKLGNMKPECEKVVYEELTEEQRKETAKIKEVMTSHFGEFFDGAEPFKFFDDVSDDDIVKFEHNGESFSMVYSFCGLYAKALDEDTNISYPDSLLAMYNKMGVNAIWVPTVLYQITKFPFAPEYSVGYEERQNRLRDLIARAKKYGIKVFIYLNEPRCLPVEFFKKYPDLQGTTRQSGLASMCTSDPRTLEWLKNSITELCEQVPGIGGFYMINFHENLTHCKSSPSLANCPRCKDIPPYKLVSDVLTAISDAATSVDESIRIVAFTWAWQHYLNPEETKTMLENLPKNIVIMSVSESAQPFEIAGVKNEIADYSMSIIGPSPRSKDIWKLARDAGHEVCAKVQVNTTWECSTIPYMPTYDLICEHMENLNKEGVTNLMLSWTLGGYPSFNLKLASEYLKNPSEDTYNRLLKEEYSEYADIVKTAASKFSDAFREFPFHLRTLYNGPQNSGPSTILYEKPSGLKSTMTCYPFDELEVWRANFPEEVFVDQFEKLSVKWADGLKCIENMPDCAFKDAAYASYTIFRSSYLQAKFIQIREKGNNAEICEVLKEERELALMLYGIMQHNNQIGYEAANHYYFSKGMLAEKVLNCDALLNRFSE